MSSPSHIQLLNLRTGGATGSAVAAVEAPGTLGTTAATSRRAAKPTRRTRKKVLMPTSVGSSVQTSARTSADEAGEGRAARANRSARVQVGRDRASRPERASATGRTTRVAGAGRSSRAVDTARTQGNIIQRICGTLTASPARMRLLVAAAVLLVAAFAIFPSVRDYYVASRDREVLSARYAELSATNDELMHDIGYLQSTEGIEDEARRRGYVLPGETGVTVEGLESVEAEPEVAVASAPWYQGMLDTIFGYTPQEW